MSISRICHLTQLLAPPPLEGVYLHLSLQRLFATTISSVLYQFDSINLLSDLLPAVPSEADPLSLADVLATLPLYLHSIVAEALMGMWKRNGEGFAREISLYAHEALTHSRIECDVAAMQIAARLMKPTKFLTVRAQQLRACQSILLYQHFRAVCKRSAISPSSSSRSLRSLNRTPSSPRRHCGYL